MAEIAYLISDGQEQPKPGKAATVLADTSREGIISFHEHANIIVVASFPTFF